jgi:hypothetical protein
LLKGEEGMLPFVKGEAEVPPFCKGRSRSPPLLQRGDGGDFWPPFAQSEFHKLSKTLGEIFDAIKTTKSVCKAPIIGGHTWIRLEAIEIYTAGYPFA